MGLSFLKFKVSHLFLIYFLRNVRRTMGVTMLLRNKSDIIKEIVVGVNT